MPPKQKKSAGLQAVTTQLHGMALGTTFRGSQPRTRVTRNGQGLMLEHQDLLGVVEESVDTGIMMGLNVPLNPAFWYGSYASRYVELYERYRIKSAIITYHPAVPTTTSGIVAGYIDRDPDDAPVDNDVSFIAAHPNSFITPAYQPASLEYDDSADGDPALLWAGVGLGQSASRLTSAGNVFIFTGTDADSGTSIGYVTIRYCIEFVYANVESTAGASANTKLESRAAMSLSNQATSEAGEIMLFDVDTGSVTAGDSGLIQTDNDKHTGLQNFIEGVTSILPKSWMPFVAVADGVVKLYRSIRDYKNNRPMLSDGVETVNVVQLDGYSFHVEEAD